ncbi:MAG: hypothetical protein LBR43_00835 [Spiroplasmataceae bacterium]|jgi:hypothetical protein|nr:hypothetical protein [Spiroplasmataceae bacterium]
MNRGVLKRKIAKNLEKLENLLDKTDDARAIEASDPETWDSDALYDLKELAKEIQELLEDKIDPKQKDEYGEPLLLETGICSLVDEYHEEEEFSDDE